MTRATPWILLLLFSCSGNRDYGSQTGHRDDEDLLAPFTADLIDLPSGPPRFEPLRWASTGRRHCLWQLVVREHAWALRRLFSRRRYCSTT